MFDEYYCLLRGNKTSRIVTCAPKQVYGIKYYWVLHDPEIYWQLLFGVDIELQCCKRLERPSNVWMIGWWCNRRLILHNQVNEFRAMLLENGLRDFMRLCWTLKFKWVKRRCFIIPSSSIIVKFRYFIAQFPQKDEASRWNRLFCFLITDESLTHMAMELDKPKERQVVNSNAVTGFNPKCSKEINFQKWTENSLIWTR